MKIHHIAIICSDYQVSKNFYTEVLGLQILREVYREERDSAAQPEQAGIRTEEESYSMLTEIIESFAEQEWVHLGQLGDIMNKRNPDFDARNYGYRNLSAMLQSKQDTFELVRGNNIGMSHNLPYVRLKS